MAKTGIKPTVVEHDRRIEEVKQALISAARRYSIVQNFTVRYGISVRTVDGYIAKAKAALDAEFEANRPYLMAEHIAHRRDLRQRMRQSGDLYGELRVAQDEAKLEGLYPATKTEISGKDGGAIVYRDETKELSDDELRRNMAEFGRVAALLAAGVGVELHGDAGGLPPPDSAG
jgi:hypothetical protein